MSKEAREFNRKLNETYNTVTIEAYKKTHKPLFSKLEESSLEKSQTSIGSTPATPAQIKQVLYRRDE